MTEILCFNKANNIFFGNMLRTVFRKKGWTSLGHEYLVYRASIRGLKISKTQGPKHHLRITLKYQINLQVLLKIQNYTNTQQTDTIVILLRIGE